MTRRLLCRYALGSTTGAGGIGAAAAEGAGAEPPQLLQPAVGQASQAVSQQALCLCLNSLLSRPHFLGPHPQPVSQLGAAISHPQLGAAPQPLPQAGVDSQPHEGSATPQLGSQDAQPLSQPFLQICSFEIKQSFLALAAQSSSSNGLRRGLQHADSTPQLGPHDSTPQVGAAPQPPPQALSTPQDGAAPQPLPQAGADSHPQLGSAAQPAPQAFSTPQLGQLHSRCHSMCCHSRNLSSRAVCQANRLRSLGYRG